jgi:aspartokinase-like uncharacterized kinase
MKVVLKLGGSLMDKGREIIQFLTEYAQKKALSFVIIPGGGPFITLTKELSERGVISDDTAHWMAVLGMHQYGYFLADDDIELVESLEELNTERPMRIVLPYNILQADDSLPHTWDVTSDTIAAFIAYKLDEKIIIKVTDVDGLMDENGQIIRQIHPRDMVEKRYTSCVDVVLPGFLLSHAMSCVIVNGTYPERIVAVLEGKETVCTKIFAPSL